mmetsp:Transcript_21597/g.42949  ORF Transcript_21597/g.42949 Transcript_21597/m.42949 type:complete len:139 (-) Transcript_21597:1202-1618(-)
MGGHSQCLSQREEPPRPTVRAESPRAQISNHPPVPYMKQKAERSTLNTEGGSKKEKCDTCRPVGYFLASSLQSRLTAEGMQIEEQPAALSCFQTSSSHRPSSSFCHSFPSIPKELPPIVPSFLKPTASFEHMQRDRDA